MPELGRFEGGNGLSYLLEQGEVLHGLENTEASRTALRALTDELLRIRDRSGRNVKLVPNRAQLEFERRRGQRNIVLKARQMGISTWVSGRLFLKTVTMPGTLTVQVAHTQEAAESLFRMVHRFTECLPKDLRKGALRTSKSSVRQIAFPELDSEYRVESAGDASAGRGLTITNLHCSEVARWPGDAAETLQGLRAAMPSEGELILESTPMGAGGCFWREWQEAPETGMVRHFFPWWMEGAYAGMAVCETTVTKEECRLMRAHGLTHAQIGYRRQLFANYRGLAKQEYAEDANECFLSSGECVFEKDAIDRRMAELRAPIEKRLRGQLQIWYPPVAGRDYLVAVDPAGGGTEGDYSAVQVMDLKMGMQCAELQCKAGGYELALEVEKLAKEYGQAMVAVERNNHGAGILAYLAGVCRYPRMFEHGGQQGWLTSTLTRPLMIGGLGAALVETPEIFSSERLLRECRTFVRHRNGKAAAQNGEHDDCLMAMAMALEVRADMLGRG
jgi:plasmid stabilization system protein ParE